MFALIALSALAGDPQVDASEPVVVYPTVTEMILDGAEVNATVAGPGGIAVTDRKRATFPPMIAIKTDFRLEMKASIAEIR